MQGLGGGGGAGGGAPDDLDLDNVLDNYLVQLQTGMGGAGGGMAGLGGMGDPLAGLGGMGMGMGAGGLGMMGGMGGMQPLAGLAGMQGQLGGMGMQGMSGLQGMAQGMGQAMQQTNPVLARNLMSSMGAGLEGFTAAGGLGSMGGGAGGMAGLAGLGAYGGMGGGGLGHGGMGAFAGMGAGLAGLQGMGLGGGLSAAGASSAAAAASAGMGLAMPGAPPMSSAPAAAPLPAATPSTGPSTSGATAGGAGTATAAGGRGSARGGRGGGRGRGAGRKAAATRAREEEEEDSDGGSSDGSASSDGGQPRNRRQKREASSGGGADNPNLSVAERRHLALQEKNRRAQRRFRERQKAKIAELHRQIEELTTKVGSLQTENAALHSRTSILEKVLDMRNEQIQHDDAGDAPPLTLSAVAGQDIQLTSEQLKALTPEQIYKLYQTYIKELSARLVELNQGGPPSATTTQQVETLTKEVSYLLMRLSVVRPIETRKFIAVSRQYLKTEAEAIDMWKNVVNSINLSEKQKHDVVSWKQMFMQKVEPIVEERKKLNIQIQAHLPQESFHTRNAITYIKTHEAVAKLRENLKAEHNVTIEFCAAVFKGVLNHFQMASLLVQAYPAVPDALAVASAVIADMADKGEALPDKIANMPDMGGLNGLSVAAPLLCPADEQNPDQPTTAAAAAAAVAAAGVLQGALIGLGTQGAQGASHLQTLQMNTTAGDSTMEQGGGAAQ
ncbi:hypothetical protein Rsub_01622 [Raphidocelis subcapitata]|uniref:BZIP domain-containing protein n=1 Tax=Raphidocelis subcapitata TaxID=307507 RepID=A0A2V0NT52_9CHLO|nr:hypothetical protein Rsub_01622 [Raphidocelis subcapitata]|eukprot:GBF88723.1 hypothetical protein Rsub_01622 [Raphidocelis subcapitata]